MEHETVFDVSTKATADGYLELLIEGSEQFVRPLFNESGGHRWQERSGNKIHTSTVTVSVRIDQQLKFELKDSDLSIEWYSGSGAGGQHRNKHQNCCRLRHIPTGIVKTAQCRSRQNSLDEARSAMIKELQYKQASSHYNQINTQRKQQTGSGMRGDWVKSYRTQDNIVTDHRTGFKMKLSDVLKGQL